MPFIIFSCHFLSHLLYIMRALFPPFRSSDCFSSIVFLHPLAVFPLLPLLVYDATVTSFTYRQIKFIHFLHLHQLLLYSTQSLF
jgi:hypothetical protein